MQNILKSKIFIGAVLALMAATAAVVIAVNGSHSGNDLQSQLDLGRKYVSEMDYENAIIAYEKVLEIDPYCTEAYFGLADAYLALGQQDKAIEIMEQAKNMLSDNVEVYVYLTQLYASQNQMDLAISTLERGIQVTDSDRLKDMLKEYQPAEEQVNPEKGDLLAEATEKEDKAPETTEASQDTEVQRNEDEERPSITIGLRQNEQRQNVEPVLIIDQNDEEVITVPLITQPSLPMLFYNDDLNDVAQSNERNQYNSSNTVSDNNGGNQNSSSDNASDNNGGNQDNDSGSNGGNQDNDSGNDLGSIGGSQGSGSDNDSGITDPDVPQTGIVGNVYGIDGQGIDGVTINIYSEQTDMPIAAGTDTIGQYIQGLAAGDYRIILSKDGYVDLSTTISVLENILMSNSYIMLTTEESRQSASLKGIVVSATDSQSIEGAEITLLNGFGKTSISDPDAVTDSSHALTEDNGLFSIDEGLNAGYYTIETSKDGYSTYHRNETIKPGENEITINMSPEIAIQGIYRIVLTWGETPRDLDSHLICTGDDDYHVYFGDKKSDDGMAELDWDDTSSYGPETITVTIESGNSYIYAVHNYTNRGASAGQSAAWNLANSGAKVVVYDDTGTIFDGNVPVNEQGTTWEVFRIENGRLVVTNNVSFDHPNTLANSDISIVSDNVNDDIPVALSSAEDKEAIEASDDTDSEEAEIESETEEETEVEETAESTDSEDSLLPDEVTIPSASEESTDLEESVEMPETGDTDLEETEIGSETEAETEEEGTAEPAGAESTADPEDDSLPDEDTLPSALIESTDSEESVETSENDVRTDSEDSDNTADSEQDTENDESVEETND